ncbi:MAG: hypothetical protein AABX38_04445 [Candidatus Micrarchaeota archaeon]
MKAQLSLEYLLLTVVILAVLFFAVANLSKLNNAATLTVDSYKFKSDAQNLFNKIDEVCILGNGNRFSAPFSSKAQFIYPDSSSKNIIGFNFSGVYVERKFKCNVAFDSNPLYGEVKIENKDGVVELTNN